MQSPFLICKFDKPTLSNIIRERFGTGFPDVFKKPQISFVYSYLRELNAKTILLETDYVDRDYLEDYSQYYVRCFSRYGERCARLHFFDGVEDKNGNEISPINHDFIQKGLKDDPRALQDELQKRYLGFIVIKPIPRTFIGKSCLKIYPRLNQHSSKKVIATTYSVNLFGLELDVESVAFQEQDKVVSACATTAIWCLMHAQKGSYKLPETPSSSRITLAAINHIENSSNSFPNGGLTIKQITRAFDVYGFRTHNIDFPNDFLEESFFNTIKYHIDSNVPLILGGTVYSIDNDQAVREGKHVVTVLGYKNHCSNKALYIHDDRFGPYARTLIKNISEFLDKSKIEIVDRKEGVDWGVFFYEKEDDISAPSDWKAPKQFIIPDHLMVVTHPKVRIESKYISNTCKIVVEQLAVYFEGLKEESKQVFTPPSVRYEIMLMELAEFRRKVVGNSKVTNRYEILTTNTPKYIWLASFFDEDNQLVFEIAFDATDIPQGDAVRHIVKHTDTWPHFLKESLGSLEKHTEPRTDNSEHFFHSVIKSLTQSKDDLWSDLDKRFGEARAPNRVKPEELESDDLNPQEREVFYGRTYKTVAQALGEIGSQGPYIWVIGLDGGLNLGKEIDGKGHPTIAGFKSARISGEISMTEDGWELISKSGRYSGDYGDKTNEYLENARQRFLEIFALESESNIFIKPYEQE